MPENNMMENPKAVQLAQRQKAAQTRVRYSRSEKPGIIIATGLISALCLLSLFASIMGVLEKKRLLQGFSQIENIIVISGQMASTDHSITNSNQEDLLAILSKLGQINADGQANGLQALTNPWGGTLTAITSQGGRIRIETTVPARACRRLLSMFGQPQTVSEILNIEVRTSQSSWLSLYSKGQHSSINEAAIKDNCGRSETTSIALIFPVHAQGQGS